MLLFSVKIVGFIGKLTKRRIYYPILDQLLRSSTSIGANVIEGKSASSRRDFIHFYEIALKSANETKYWLCLLRDGLKNQPERNRTISERSCGDFENSWFQYYQIKKIVNGFF